MPSPDRRLRGAARQIVRHSEWICRRVTSRYRRLPDFLIIGAQKSGTSSLFHYLRQHPALRPAFKKEVHYFDGGLKNGASWYRSHFCLDRPGGREAVKAFEASPLYIFHPLAARRIHDLIPDVKLVVVLRNPVERAISQYFHSSRRGRESLPLMAALQQEEERLAPAIRDENYDDESFIHHSYKRRGLYHEQIARYLSYFPVDNMLLISSEALFSRPHEILPRVFRFVGVDDGVGTSDLTSRNVGGDKTGIDPGVREYLADYFRSPNRQLYDLTGQAVGW